MRSRPRPMLRAAGVVLHVAVLAGVACGRSGPRAPHSDLAGNVAPLRAAFNADSGRVRAIFLASPT